MFKTRYLYCSVNSVEAVMPKIREAGLGIEVLFDDTSSLWPQTKWENLLQVADEIQDSGIEAAIHGPFDNVNLGSRDPSMQEISLKMLMGGLEFARAVRAPHMVMHSGFLPQYPPARRAKWLDQFCANVEILLDRAAELEVRIALENTY